jgi:hypothetical protein
MIMKKLTSINIYKASVWCLIGIIGFTLTSCIEEGENEIEGKGTNFVRIIAEVESDSEMNFGSASFAAVPGDGVFLEIRRDPVSGSITNQPATVSYVIDNSIVDEYNAYVDEYNLYVDEYNSDLDKDDDGFEEADPLDYKVHHNILDENLYSIETTTVNFAAGELVKYVKMDLDPSTLSFLEKYSLGVKFTNITEGYVATQGGDKVLVQIIIKNQYHGTYGAKGFFTHPTPTSSREIDRDKELLTTGPNSVITELGDLGTSGYEMELFINPDNTVTIVGYIGGVETTLKTDYQVNTYDPLTGKFDLKYSYNSGAPRIINEILSPK